MEAQFGVLKDFYGELRDQFQLPYLGGFAHGIARMPRIGYALHSMTALSSTAPFWPIDTSIPASFRCSPIAKDTYCDPWSEWCTSPGPERRREIAISTASTTSSARRCSWSDQPTTLRE
jgi:hypothetical protein